MVAAPAGPGGGGAPLSPCAGFVADSLILPTRNARLFAPVFALVLAHTFVFLAVAVHFAHEYALSGPTIWLHPAALLVLHLAYLASKLATQAAVALAGCATLCGDRPRSLAELVRGTPPAPCPLRRRRAGRRRGARVHGRPGVLSGLLVQGVLLFVFLATLLFRLCLAAVFPVAVAASATAATEEAGDGGGGASAAAHLQRAWRLMTAAASWKEAAVQVVVVSVVLPLATYPVYAFALDCGQGGCVLLLGWMYGFLLPSAGVQLYSTVAATVFYHRCMEQQRHELAIPLTMKVMKLGGTPLNSLKLIKGGIA
uniref:Uncharacterized protein n=1 Tax=Triticum aestivum TaxID=4565 RepID=A0A077S6S3_WHEAT|nr:unnamed protein product [Triticum aestivum]